MGFCNILEPLNAIIDFEKRELKTKYSVCKLIFDKNNDDNNRDFQDKEFENFNSEIIDIQFHKPDIKKVAEKLITDNLNIEEIQNLTHLIKRFNSVFYKEGDILSKTISKYQHKIPTINDIPVYSKAYRFPEIHREVVEKQIKEMLDSGMLVKSFSPYNAPIWVVPKKLDSSKVQKWRVVIDLSRYG